MHNRDLERSRSTSLFTSSQVCIVRYGLWTNWERRTQPMKRCVTQVWSAAQCVADGLKRERRAAACGRVKTKEECLCDCVLFMHSVFKSVCIHHPSKPKIWNKSNMQDDTRLIRRRCQRFLNLFQTLEFGWIKTRSRRVQLKTFIHLKVYFKEE